jgi:hypothetical protein
LSVLDGLNHFIETYIRIFRGLRSVKLLAPFLIMGCFKVLLLTALILFYLPPVYKMLIPILGYFYSDRVLHFPYFYLVLPQIFMYGSSLVLDFVFGIILYAAAVFIIGTNIKQERGGLAEGIRTALKSWGALILVWVLKTLILAVIFQFGWSLVIPILHGLPFADFSAFLTVQIAGLIFTTFLVYAVPAIMLHRQGFWAAILTSIQFAGKNFIYSFFLVFIPWLISLPLSYFIFSKVHIIISKFSYSVMIYLLGLDIILTVFTSFVLLSGITYFYLSKTE